MNILSWGEASGGFLGILFAICTLFTLDRLQHKELEQKHGSAHSWQWKGNAPTIFGRVIWILFRFDVAATDAVAARTYDMIPASGILFHILTFSKFTLPL